MVSKPRQKAPKTEEPDGEKRYKVVRLKAFPESGIPDRGFGIWDNRHKRVVADEFNTPEEASAYINEHLTPKTEPKPKLKTMNEISAAEAAKLFRAARNFDCDGAPMDDYCLRPEAFPQDMAARDFLQCLELYSRMDSEGSEYPFASNTSSNTSYTVEHRISDEQINKQINEVRNTAASITKEELEELVKRLTPAQRKVFDRIVDGSHPRLKDFINDKTLISDETGKQMAEGTIRVHVSAICKIFGVSNRKTLVAKVKPLLPPKAKQRHPK